MMVTIDDVTLARAVLTFCLDSADAMMYALVKGTGSAASALQLIADSGPGNHENVTAAACTSLDAAFINGVTRWGRTINARGMASFHGSLVSWQQRLASLPSKLSLINNPEPNKIRPNSYGRLRLKKKKKK